MKANDLNCVSESECNYNTNKSNTNHYPFTRNSQSIKAKPEFNKALLTKTSSCMSDMNELRAAYHIVG